MPGRRWRNAPSMFFSCTWKSRDKSILKKNWSKVWKINNRRSFRRVWNYFVAVYRMWHIDWPRHSLFLTLLFQRIRFESSTDQTLSQISDSIARWSRQDRAWRGKDPARRDLQVDRETNTHANDTECQAYSSTLERSFTACSPLLMLDARAANWIRQAWSEWRR